MTRSTTPLSKPKIAKNNESPKTTTTTTTTSTTTTTTTKRPTTQKSTTTTTMEAKTTSPMDADPSKVTSKNRRQKTSKGDTIFGPTNGLNLCYMS